AEAKTQQRRLDARRNGIPLARVKFFEQRAIALQVCSTASLLCQARLQDGHLCLHIQERTEGFTDLLVQRAVSFHRHFLGEIAQPQTTAPFHRPAIGGHPTAHNVEELPFATAVRADESNVTPRLNLPRDVLQDRHTSKRFHEMFYTNE